MTYISIYIHFTILLLMILVINNNDIIVIKLYTIPQTLIYCFLNGKIYQPLIIDTESDITIIPEKKLHILQNPKQLTNITITYRQKQVSAIEFVDTWNIICPNSNLQLLNNFHFLMVNEDLSFFVGYPSFAFAHLIQNEKYSLVHNFYKDNFIKHKIFSLWKSHSILHDNLLILGKVPSNYTKYDKSGFEIHKYIIHVKPKSIYWESQLNGFIISNNKTEKFYYKNKYPLLFSANYEGIYVPKDIYMNIKEVYFGNLFKENKCISGTYYIECSCYHIKYLGNITFIFNDIEINIQPHDIFSENEEFECTFIMFENSNTKIDGNYWIIGMAGFLLESTISFNYDRDQIEIYSSNLNGRFKNINNIRVTMRINVYIFIILLLIINVIFLIYVNRKSK